MADYFAFGEALIFLCCVVLALLAAWLTVSGARPDSPAWPVRLYLYFFRSSGVPWFRRYPDTRTTFSRREQFLTSWFIWFFIFFVAAIYLFECHRRGTCF